MQLFEQWYARVFYVMLPVFWSGHSSLGAEVPDAAVEAWRMIDMRTEAGQISALTSSWYKNKQLTNQAPYVLLKNKACILTEEVPPDAGMGSAQRKMSLRNEKGSYALQANGGSKWVLTYAAPAKDERPKNVLSLDRVDAILAMPIRVFGTTLHDLYEHQSEKFGSWEEITDEQGHNLIRFKIGEVDEVQEAAIPAGDYEFVVDPAKEFRIVEMSYKSPAGLVYTSHRKFDKELPNNFPSAEEIVSVDSAGTELTRSEITLESVTLSPPPDAVFTLAHYGVPEVEFSSRSGRSYIWYLSSISVGLLALAGYFYFRSRE